jgi:hypothetical protein
MSKDLPLVIMLMSLSILWIMPKKLMYFNVLFLNPKAKRIFSWSKAGKSTLKPKVGRPPLLAVHIIIFSLLSIHYTKI